MVCLSWLACFLYWKPTFCGVYSNSEKVLRSVYKFGMVYTSVIDVFTFAQIGHKSILN